MAEPAVSGRRPSANPYLLLWPGVLVCGALLLMLVVTRAEQVQGQLADVPASVMVLTALLMGTAFRGSAWPRRLVEFAARPRSLALIAFAAFVLLALGTLFVFGTKPLSGDEQAHLFQARLFAQFKLVANYPPDLLDRVVPVGIQNDVILVARDGRAMSVYWPGWALLMTPFVWLGVPWLLGPAMASLGLYVIGRLASLLAGAQAAAVAIVLALTSGAFIVTGMSLYPAGGYLTLNLLYSWLLLRGGRRDALLAGFVGGLALNLNNPVPHALFALPWLIWLAKDPVRRRRLVWLAIGYAPWIAVAFVWLAATSSLTASSGDPGGSFWRDRLPLLVNVPTIRIIWLRFWELTRVWIWGAPGLLVLAAVAWRRSAMGSAAWLLGLSFGFVVVMYAFFPDGQGLGWGARYYQAAWGALPILAAILLMRPDMERLRPMVLIAALAGLALVVPVQVSYARDLANVGYPPLRALEVPGADLYFVVTTKWGDPPITTNDPSLTGPLVLVSYGPAADQELVDRLYPGSRLVISNSSGSGYARP
jgi:hypothetical protein